MNKKYLGIIIAIIAIFLISVTIIALQVSAEPVKLEGLTEDSGCYYYEANPNKITYFYNVTGIISNLNNENHRVEVKFVHLNATTIDNDIKYLKATDIKDGKYSFNFKTEHNYKANMSHILIDVYDLNNDLLISEMVSIDNSNKIPFCIDSVDSSNKTTTANNSDGDGWKTVTIIYPEIITKDNAENLYYDGYSFSFQIKGDNSATMFVVPDSLYDKFKQIYTNDLNTNSGTKLKIKYRSGTTKAELNDEIYPINIVTDVKEV